MAAKNVSLHEVWEKAHIQTKALEKTTSLTHFIAATTCYVQNEHGNLC